MKIKGIPLQPHLSPNARVHWRVKAKAVKLLKEAAYLCACEARGQVWEVFNRPVIELTFYIKDNRRHDPDNALAMCKPIFDSLILAELIRTDKDVTHKPIRWVIDKERAGTVDMEIRESTLRGRE